jgi:hypothetical protein
MDGHMKKRAALLLPISIHNGGDVLILKTSLQSEVVEERSCCLLKPRRTRSILAMLFLLLVPLWSQATSAHASSNMVSMVRLIAVPEKYAGRQVQVLGFLSIAEEEEALYLSQEDYLHGVATSSLSLRLAGDQRNRAKALNLKYVLVEGTLSLQKGPFKWGNATIVNVHRLEEWNIHRQPAPGVSQER